MRVMLYNKKHFNCTFLYNETFCWTLGMFTETYNIALYNDPLCTELLNKFMHDTDVLFSRP